MNIYNTHRMVSSYSNINGDVNSSELKIDYNKHNNNPGIGRLYLRDNNKAGELFFKEGEFVNYLRKKTKSKKSLLNRIKNLTKKKNKKKNKKSRKKKKKNHRKKKKKK